VRQLADLRLVQLGECDGEEILFVHAKTFLPPDRTLCGLPDREMSVLRR
jgi:hypothetical protein